MYDAGNAHRNRTWNFLSKRRTYAIGNHCPAEAVHNTRSLILNSSAMRTDISIAKSHEMIEVKHRLDEPENSLLGD